MYVTWNFELIHVQLWNFTPQATIFLWIEEMISIRNQNKTNCGPIKCSLVHSTNSNVEKQSLHISNPITCIHKLSMCQKDGKLNMLSSKLLTKRPICRNSPIVFDVCQRLYSVWFQFTFQIQFNITVHISKVSDQSLSLTVFHRVSSSPAKHSNSISHWGSYPSVP